MRLLISILFVFATSIMGTSELYANPKWDIAATNLPDKNITLTSESGRLIIQNTGTETIVFELYSIVGKIIFQKTLSSNSTTTITLPGGCYLWRVGESVQKVIIP